MKVLLAIILSAPVFGASPWFVTQNSRPCLVTAATNATPIRVTVDSASGCGIVSNGQNILVVEVGSSVAGGVSSANINSDSVDQLVRRVANLSGNSFDLQDGAGVSVAGNGTYTNGGRISLATQSALKAHPIGYLDGPGGAIVSSVSNTSATGRAYASRPAMVALLAQCDSWPTAWGTDRYGEHAFGFALCWMATGSATYRTKALALLDDIDQALPTTACKTTASGCGQSSSLGIDYPSQMQENWASAYSIMHAEMSAPARAKFVNWALNDQPWQYGGLGPTGTSLTAPDWNTYNTNGTVAVSGNTVTGSGTNFTSTASPGDIFQTHSNDFDAGYQIASVNSDTSISLVQTVAENKSAGTLYKIGPPWDASQYGLMWQAKHYDAAVLCGGAWRLHLGYLRSCNAGYPTASGLAGYYSAPDQNLTVARIQGYVFLGLATCDDDIRGCLLLEQAAEWTHNLIIPRGMNMWSGFTQSTHGYQTGRMHNIPISVDAAIRNSTVGGISHLSASALPANLMKWGYAAPIVPRGIWMPGVENSEAYIVANMYRGPLTALFHSPGIPEAAHLRHHLFNEVGANANFMQYNTGAYAWFWFLHDDPAITPVTPPTTTHFLETDHDLCVTRYGSGSCPTDEFELATISKTGHGSTDTYLGINAISNKCSDHCLESYSAPAWPILQKNGRVLLGNDHSTYYASREQRAYLEFGGTATNLKSINEPTSAVSYWYAGDDDFSVWNANLTSIYKAAANVTTAARQWIHLKAGAQDYVIDHVRAVASSATQIRARQLHPLNGCGTVDSTSCVSFSAAGKTITTTFTTPNARLLGKAIGLGGLDIATKTADGNDAHGSYGGGAGTAFGWEVCPSTDGGSTCDTSETTAEWAIVWKPTTDTAGTMPTIVQSSSGSFRTVEIQDASSPAVAVFTAGGVTAASASFATTHASTALYVFSGVTPGTYDIARNGTPVCSGVVVVAGDNTMKCSMASGSISFAVAGAPPVVTITTSSPLPTGATTVAYSQSIAATGGTGPYTYAVVSGALPAGLALSSGGALTGTPTLNGAYSFTVRATDALSVTGDKAFSLTINLTSPPATLRTMRFKFSPPRGRTLTHLHFDWGSTISLGTSIVTACASGCTVTLDANSAATMYYRFRWYNSATPAGAASKIRSVLVP